MKILYLILLGLFFIQPSFGQSEKPQSNITISITEETAVKYKKALITSIYIVVTTGQIEKTESIKFAETQSLGGTELKVNGTSPDETYSDKKETTFSWSPSNTSMIAQMISNIRRVKQSSKNSGFDDFAALQSILGTGSNPKAVVFGYIQKNK